MTIEPQIIFDEAYQLALIDAAYIAGVRLDERAKIPAHLRRSIEAGLRDGQRDSEYLAAEALSFARQQLQIARSASCLRPTRLAYNE